MKAKFVKKNIFIFILFNLSISAFAQHENKNWYFGTGSDGIIFNNNIPTKVTNKYPGIGFEGIVVVSDPFTGDLLFYSDGINVINKNHTVMSNGTGLSGHSSGAQSVQCCPVPGSCGKQFYLFTNSAYDNHNGIIKYSIIDFTVNPLGNVINKNTAFWAGPSDEGMCMVKKPSSNDYWIIANTFNSANYYVWPVSAAGIGLPVIYSFSNVGSSYQINYNEAAQKIVVTGWSSKHVTTINFNAVTGVLYNEMQLAPNTFGDCYAARFSPDGSKLYVGTALTLHQYDFLNSTWTNMNTCCNAHDVKMGPDGKMYFIHTHNSSQPIGVIDYPDSSAVANSCGYHTITFPFSFGGAVRRFPEFLVYPEQTVATQDSFNVSVSLPASLNVLSNDMDPQGDTLILDSLIFGPFYGNAMISNGQINYTADTGTCGKTDTLIYRLRDVNCSYDTALVLVYINCGLFPNASFACSDTNFCDKQYVDFLDFSTNNPTSWQWSFPGAVPSTDTNQNPVNIFYPSYGSFDVSLIACNAIGCDTLTLIDFIHEFQPPPLPIVTSNFDTLFSSVAFSYQWYNAIGIIVGATNQYYIYQQPDNFYVIITDSNGCASSSNVFATSVTEVFNNNQDFFVSPNPNGGHFEIILTDKFETIESCIVCDVTGRNIMVSSFQRANGIHGIDLLEPANGIYVLRFESNKRIVNKRLVVNR